MSHSNRASKELSKVSLIYTSLASKKRVLNVPWWEGVEGLEQANLKSSNGQGLPEGGGQGVEVWN